MLNRVFDLGQYDVYFNQINFLCRLSVVRKQGIFEILPVGDDRITQALQFRYPLRRRYCGKSGKVVLLLVKNTRDVGRRSVRRLFNGGHDADSMPKSEWGVNIGDGGVRHH